MFIVLPSGLTSIREPWGIRDPKLMRRSPVHILLVEDDEDDYLIVRDLLSDIDGTTFHIDWVSGYAEATQRIHPHRYDIFLFDYRYATSIASKYIDRHYIKSV